MSTDPTIAFFAGQLGAPRCMVCDKLLRVDTTEVLCRECARRVPPAVDRALKGEAGPFALGLRSGTTIQFGGATCHGEFVTLRGVRQFVPAVPPLVGGPAGDWPGGIDVRLDEIAWAADTADSG